MLLLAYKQSILLRISSNNSEIFFPFSSSFAIIYYNSNNLYEFCTLQSDSSSTLPLFSKSSLFTLQSNSSSILPLLSRSSLFTGLCDILFKTSSATLHSQCYYPSIFDKLEPSTILRFGAITFPLMLLFCYC